MKVIICPDSFKGSLSSIDVADAVARGIAQVVNTTKLQSVKVPVADGGEGTVDALVIATGGKKISASVNDPLLRKIDSYFGVLGDGNTAVIEMAAASGLYLLSQNERNPLIASTYGTGELIARAVESGAEKIIIGIGGSATNDGGAGAMSALGARFLDSDGIEIPAGGAALSKLHSIDMTGFYFPTGKIKVDVACDVTNPLCGDEGASAVFGPQKGASPEMVAELDHALQNYAEVIKRDIGKDIINMPGAGAAGGLGAGLAAFLDARLRSGIDIVLDAADFDKQIEGATLVITGEGRIDEQTAYGKTIAGILKRTSRVGVPVVAICGSLEGDISSLYDSGLTSAFSIAPGPVSLDYAMQNASIMIESLCANIARLLLR